MLLPKHTSSVLRNKDQMGVKCKNAVSSGANVLKFFHRPIIIQLMQTVKNLRLRVKDKHSKMLMALAREVNQVWNYCNETSARAIRERGKWLSGFDLQKLTAGYSKCEGVQIGSTTVQQVCEEYAVRRKQFKKAKLNWRVSNAKSSKHSLGWVPFKAGAVKFKAGQVKFAGSLYSLWDSYDLSKYELRSGSFSQDARGRWYLNVAVQVETAKSTGTASVGIDLGLKTVATTSTGETLEGRWYRDAECALSKAQKANKKQRVKAISAQIANRRKDALHKFSSSIVASNAAVFVGNVASTKLVKTRMAKSTLDAGWSMLKTMLEYKCHQAGVVFEVVDESYSTQTCSECGSIQGPKGLSGLRIREWTCGNCGATHDRDTNAAKNILARGHSRLAVGISAL